MPSSFEAISSLVDYYEFYDNGNVVREDSWSSNNDCYEFKSYEVSQILRQLVHYLCGCESMGTFR